GLGQNFESRFVRGIRSYIGAAISADTRLHSAAINAVKRKQKSASTSKVFIDLAHDNTDGFNGGMQDRVRDTEKTPTVLASSTIGAFDSTMGKNAFSIDTDGVRMQMNSLRKDMRSDLGSIKSTATLEMGERSRPVVHVHNHGDVDMIRTEIEHR